MKLKFAHLINGVVVMSVCWVSAYSMASDLRDEGNTNTYTNTNTNNSILSRFPGSGSEIASQLLRVLKTQTTPYTSQSKERVLEALIRVRHEYMVAHGELNENTLNH